ncbi:amino acid adenylation domain-containing protein [Myceligenerans pegani]|uniref:Amino acid adenylation domain-containing protein n=1 Tax=Myceligenerans pegani TaxID=2776917 RepID=A0ABR9MYT0_9MICO|nr:amino acid adenylation domain-containing protein [Myceligenerans sp. TRM 65318]MBE1876191.1 amino acid adenylation domain-containing protein [Myceligenerans sp. TRM 65318]MBE3018462.1 amino acid adenylation domain-containing protein [Myceligenerans sp. TRM 65318]
MTNRIDRSALIGLTPLDQELFRRFGAGASAPPPFVLLHRAFEAMARLRPGTVAVTHAGEALTYRELDRRANLLAGSLVRLGVGPGNRVGLFVKRSIPMVVGILGVLKAGAAYVPQDARITSGAHLAHIAATADIRVVLTLSEFVTALPALPGRVVLAVDKLSGERAEPPAVASAPGGPAMVIFTSGTTGAPNGVAVTHANLCNVVTHGPGALGVRPGMKVSQLLNIAFDMAAWEIFVALCRGAELVIRGDSILQAVRSVDVVIATPSVLASLDPALCRNVAVVAVAGERCPRPLADAWSSFARFHNACGPTEVTIVNTIAPPHRRGEEPTIGSPLPNTTVYVLDERLRPCPIGEVGELWAGGACVSQGYLGNPELTAQRYRPDPFLGGENRMFRTRDLGRWTPDGRLEHHGRTDEQVKVRGFRVELDAITAALERTPGCERAATVLHDGELVGFVTPAGVDAVAAGYVVAGILPYYCVPATVRAVAELPTTHRGKVDKRALVAGLTTEEAMA